MYTPHGHHIPGTDYEIQSWAGKVKNCGGYGVCKECSAYELIKFAPKEPKGVWFVYGQDLVVCPLFIHSDELVARRWAYDHSSAHVKFWEFGKTWDEVE